MPIMAGRQYAIDKHPLKEQIIAEILQGVSFRRISAHFDTDKNNVSSNAILRYAKDVLKKDLSVWIESKKDGKDKTFATLDQCIANLQYTIDKSKQCADKWFGYLEEQGTAYDSNLQRNFIAVLKQLQSSTDSLGRWVGLLHDNDTTIINQISTTDAEFISMIIDILDDELADNPDVLQRIVSRLQSGKK